MALPSRLALALALLLCAAAVAADPSRARPSAQAGADAADGSQGCLACHAGIEDMHPAARLSCVDCHGGDATARGKREAHVQPQRDPPDDERVPDLESDLAWRRFRNPMDLRAVDATCGQCHAELVRHLRVSLHGTTAGHLSDGFYEVGLLEDKQSRFAVFPVFPYMAEPGGEVDQLVQVPPFRDRDPRDELATHYTDLARKECMQCHLYSSGRALRGRVGFDGDYRGEGCAACHVEYALDGYSRSADPTVPKNEPGHPRAHAMTRAPTTQTCTTCHYGDASIGLHFRGLSQLPPGAPGGPNIPGTTDRQLNRTFYLDDPAVTPRDVHHERGMHCIDCHTLSDVMGDGKLHGKMEHAVEISCSDCHGTFDEPAPLRTRRGTPLEHLRRRGDEVVLTSKVDGREHPVPQAVHVLDPSRPEYNERAAAAMTPEHAGVECYACHAGWNVNFPGFHFDRNESLTQLDLLSGKRTPGRVTTQEKTFATWKSFYAGLNEAGRVAPYLTGFATMGTVRDRDGRVILDQVLPETAAGLSGLTMIHHQLHSTRPTARSCVECHRSSATWGLGSLNFRLARQLAFAADRRGVEVLAVDRRDPAASVPLAKIVLPDVVDLEIETDLLQGRARHVFAAEGHRGVHTLDVRDPARPRRVGFRATVSPRGMALGGDHLYVADGIGGLKVFDASDPAELELVRAVPMFDAHEVFLQWPFAYVADGPGGLAIVDVREPAHARVVGTVKLARELDTPDAALDVEVLFQYSRPLADPEDPGRPSDARTPARLLAAVLDEDEGLVLVDVTEPSAARVLWPREPEPQDGDGTDAGEGARAEGRRGRERQRTRADDPTLRFVDLALRSHVDLADPQGGTRTRERDYVYLLTEREQRNGRRSSGFQVLDVTDPEDVEAVGAVNAGFSTEQLVAASVYNPPLLTTLILTPGELGVFAADATISAEPDQRGAIAGLGEVWAVAVEEFPLDRMLDESGRPLKDVSHPGSRWLELQEIARVLAVPGERLGTLPARGAPGHPGDAARHFLAEHDADGSGLLEGDELAAAGSAVDRDGDGRLSLADVADRAGVVPRPEESPTEVARRDAGPFRNTRGGPDGDLARLLDAVRPYDFDRDQDERLDPEELRRAFFAALDLDGDERLTLDELSRQPGPLRALRFRDAAARELFEAQDRNGSGDVSLREYALRDEDLRALDADADGDVQLPQDIDPWWTSRGFVGPLSEWPARQPLFSGLPPHATLERVLEVFDRDGNGVLTQRELKDRPDLFFELDPDGSDRVTEDEIVQRVGVVANEGVDALTDAFVLRWDLDGDGEVSDDELPEAARIALEREPPE